MELNKRKTKLIKSGIYILYKYDYVVYVGESGNINSRLGDHTKQKDFHSYRILKCNNIKIRKKWEKYLINSFQPMYNKQIKHYRDFPHYLGSVHKGGFYLLKNNYLSTGFVDSNLNYLVPSKLLFNRGFVSNKEGNINIIDLNNHKTLKRDCWYVDNSNHIKNYADGGTLVTEKEAMELEHEILKDKKRTKKELIIKEKLWQFWTKDIESVIDESFPLKEEFIKIMEKGKKTNNYYKLKKYLHAPKNGKEILQLGIKPWSLNKSEMMHALRIVN